MTIIELFLGLVLTEWLVEIPNRQYLGYYVSDLDKATLYPADMVLYHCNK